MTAKPSLKRIGLIVFLIAAASITLSQLLPQAWDVESLVLGVGATGAVIVLLICLWRSPGGFTASQKAVLKMQGIFCAGWLLLVSAPAFVLVGPEPAIISALAGGLVASLLWIVRLR